MSDEQLQDIYNAVERIPIVEITYSIVPVNERNEVLENCKILFNGNNTIV